MTHARHSSPFSVCRTVIINVVVVPGAVPRLNATALTIPPLAGGASRAVNTHVVYLGLLPPRPRVCGQTRRRAAARPGCVSIGAPSETGGERSAVAARFKRAGHHVRYALRYVGVGAVEEEVITIKICSNGKRSGSVI